MDEKKVAFLNETAREIRKLTINAMANFGFGHIGGSMSIVEVVTVLYFDEMNVDPANPKKEGRDRLVLSKGHAGPALYAALALKGFFPADWLDTLNKPHTNLPSHVDMTKTPGIDMSTGSLGQGMSCAVGVALGAQIKGSGEYTYVIIGDGESQEGGNWEASMSAAQYGLDRYIAFLDYNKMQIDGMVDDVMSLIDPCKKWDAFGFNTYRVDGHDVAAISDAIKQAKAARNGKPSMIVLDTIKGKGVSFFEAEGLANHHMPVSREMGDRALEELDRGVQ